MKHDNKCERGEKQIKTNQNPQNDLGQSAASAAAALRAVYLSALARWCCRRIPTRALLQPVALETEPRMGVGGWWCSNAASSGQ